MLLFQYEVTLPAYRRGAHLVTDAIVRAMTDLERIDSGIAHVFLRHTSGSLTINENADPDVRRDLDSWLDRHVPDGDPEFVHTAEGPDDMPAHVKNVLVGTSVTIPVRHGELALGTWQGIWLCEHRTRGGSRSVVATVWGHERQR